MATASEVTADAAASFDASDEETKPVSRMKLFLRSSIIDFLLVLVAATALAFTVTYGFESAPGLRGSVLLDAGLMTPLLLILFAGSWSKRALLPAAVLGVAYAVAVCVGCFMMSSGVELFVDNQVNDVANNYAIYALVLMVVAALTYLLTRRPFGALLYVLAGAFTCAFVQYLYRDWMETQPGFAAFVVFLLASFALLGYQRYRSSIYKVHHLKKTAFAGAAGFSLGLAGLVLLCGVGLYYGIIAGLGLTTLDIRPFEDYYQRPIEYYTGVYETQDVTDPNLVSGYMSDTKRMTSNNTSGGTTDEDDTEIMESEENPLTTFVDTVTSFNINDWTQQFNAISYRTLALGAVIVAVLLALIITAIVLLWRRRRVQRIRKLDDKSDSYACWFLYEFLAKDFAKLGFVRPQNLTLLEFALANRQKMAGYAKDAEGTDWLDCTLIYQRASLADGSATAEDREAMERFYWSFYQNAYRLKGKRAWAFKWFWRL